MYTHIHIHNVREKDSTWIIILAYLHMFNCREKKKKKLNPFSDQHWMYDAKEAIFCQYFKYIPKEMGKTNHRSSSSYNGVKQIEWLPVKDSSLCVALFFLQFFLLHFVAPNIPFRSSVDNHALRLLCIHSLSVFSSHNSFELFLFYFFSCFACSIYRQRDRECKHFVVWIWWARIKRSFM